MSIPFMQSEFALRIQDYLPQYLSFHFIEIWQSTNSPEEKTILLKNLTDIQEKPTVHLLFSAVIISGKSRALANVNSEIYKFVHGFGPPVNGFPDVRYINKKKGIVENLGNIDRTYEALDKMIRSKVGTNATSKHIKGMVYEKKNQINKSRKNKKNKSRKNKSRKRR